MKKIYYRTNGYVIEFLKFDRYLIFYNIKKILAFCFDITLFIGVLMALIYILGTSILLSFIYTYFLFLLYMFLIMNILKNKTLGMLFAGLEIGSFDGNIVAKSNIYNRAFLNSIYTIPFLGWTLIVVSFFSIFLNRGLSPVDIFSKTQVFTKSFHKQLINIYKDIELSEKYKENKW